MTNAKKPVLQQQWLYRLVPFAADITVLAAALFAAYTLRYNFNWERLHAETAHILLQGAIVITLYVGSLAAFGCYRLIWRFITVDDVPRFVYASLLPTLGLAAIMALLPARSSLRMPIGVVILNGTFVLGGLLLTRAFWRIARNGGEAKRKPGEHQRILLVGAGSTGNQVLREMLQHQRQRYRVVGFIDDAPVKQRAILQGIRVLGTVDQLDGLIVRHKIDQVIVTVARAPRALLEQVNACCKHHDIPVRIVPDYYEVITGSVTVNRLREIDITDLLGREEGVLDDLAAVAFFSGKRVLVTGGGGTIGSELIRQVARIGPTHLVFVERSENALYEIERDLRARSYDVPITPLLGDIGDDERMAAIMAEYKPNIILHAAAHKHVPLMQSNPCEALKNNVLATRRLGLLAIRYHVNNFLLISTDKALRPTSVMGATKRLAEHVIQSLNNVGDTRFYAVRFGNVLGSSGSVVPLFREQIKAGGPVTITHPEMARYFMTTREAVRLVLHTAALAAGGEIFVLDMGKPVKILDLAEMMIRLSGLTPHGDIAITFTGIRPGEKLHEELDVSDGSVMKTEHARVFITNVPQRPAAEIKRMCAGLEELARSNGTSDNATRTAILEWVRKLDT